MAGMYEVNSYDGHQASNIWSAMNKQQTVIKYFAFERYMFVATGAFSAYTLARLGSLSSSGRIAAVSGLVFSAYSLFAIQTFGKNAREASGLLPATPVAQVAVEWNKSKQMTEKQNLNLYFIR